MHLRALKRATWDFLVLATVVCLTIGLLTGAAIVIAYEIGILKSEK